MQRKATKTTHLLGKLSRDYFISSRKTLNHNAYCKVDTALLKSHMKIYYPWHSNYSKFGIFWYWCHLVKRWRYNWILFYTRFCNFLKITFYQNTTWNMACHQILLIILLIEKENLNSWLKRVYYCSLSKAPFPIVISLLKMY